MSDSPQAVEFGRLSERMDHVVRAVEHMSRILEALEERFVRKDHHLANVAALEGRVKAIEDARLEEKKNGGMLGWWKNVTAVFAGFAVIATVVGVGVALVLRVYRP